MWHRVIHYILTEWVTPTYNNSLNVDIFINLERTLAEDFRFSGLQKYMICWRCGSAPLRGYFEWKRHLENRCTNKTAQLTSGGHTLLSPRAVSLYGTRWRFSLFLAASHIIRLCKFSFRCTQRYILILLILWFNVNLI